MNPEDIHAALLANETEIKHMAGSGNQGAAYLRLFEITGNANWLITGQISTFSGTLGGLAAGANLDLQRQMGAAYPGIGFISTQVASDEVRRFYDQLHEDESFAWTFQQTIGSAQETWSDHNIGAAFPGTALINIYNAFSLGNLESFEALLTLDWNRYGGSLRDYAGMPGYTVGNFTVNDATMAGLPSPIAALLADGDGLGDIRITYVRDPSGNIEFFQVDHANGVGMADILFSSPEQARALLAVALAPTLGVPNAIAFVSAAMLDRNAYRVLRVITNANSISVEAAQQILEQRGAQWRPTSWHGEPEDGGVSLDELQADLVLAAELRLWIADQQAIGEINAAGDMGRQFASMLGNVLPINDPFERAAASAMIGTIGENIAEAIEAGGIATKLPSGKIYNVLNDALGELGTNLLSGGIGTVSSILVADLIDSLDLDGTLYGDWLQTAWSSQVTAIITNLPGIVAGTTQITDVLATVDLANLFGGFIGTQLASALIEFDTVGGQIGASIGSTVGTLFGAKLLTKIGLSVGGPLGAAIGAFVGYIVGGLIGSLFGGTAKSGAGLYWNGSDNAFAVGASWSKNGGSRDVVRSFASNVAELLNGVVEASGARVLDPYGVQTGAYETKGKDFIYKPSMAGDYAFRTKDAGKLVAHGQFIALSDLSTRLMGGDVYVKRALAATLAQAGGDPDSDNTFAAGAFEANTLLGNIATAQDYAHYLQNAAVINALIAAEPQSAFTAGWTITFARVMELGLDKRGLSDWIGGWNAFLDETMDGAIDGRAFTPANLFLELDPETNERLFIFVDGEGALLGVLGDTIDTASKDVIEGTSGNDTINVAGDAVTLTAALTLNGEAAPNGAHTIRVAARIDGGAGDDTIRGGDLGNDLLGGEGNDTLVGGKLDDWLVGGAGNDRLFAGAATTSFTAGDANAEAAAIAVDSGNGDYLDGGDGDDALYGGKGGDWLRGGAGVDILLGGAGGDILDAGAGDDRGANGEARIFGGAGSDQYVFNIGDGHDIIFDESDPAGTPGEPEAPIKSRIDAMTAGTLARNWAGDGQYEADGSVKGGEDAIVFGPGLTFRDLVLRRSEVSGQPGPDLIIELTARDENGARVPTGDSITVKDWFDTVRRVEWLRFASGEGIRIGDIGAFVIGTAANDIVIGTHGSDFLLGGDGDDVLRGLAGDDFGFGGRGRDFVAGDGDNDWVLGGDDDDHVVGGDGNDTAFGDDGNDIVYGGAGDDLISGGRGDDVMIGGAGDDLFRFERGDGRDIVYDEHSNNWENVWVSGSYVNGYTIVEGDVVKGGVTYFDDGVWLGTYDYNDSTQVMRRHLGADAQGRHTANAGSDTLEFGVGIDIADLIVRRVGADLVLYITEGELDASTLSGVADTITLKEWFSTGAQIETFVFVETGRHTISNWAFGASVTDGDDTLSGASGADWLTGAGGDDTISGAGGADILAGNHGADTLSGGAGDDILFGGAGSDLIDGGTGADKIFGGDGIDIATYASSTGSGVGVRAFIAYAQYNTLEAAGDVYDGVEGLEGSSRADRLVGDAKDNVLRGLGGADLLQGGAGDDAYEIERNAGDDVIQDGILTIERVLDASGALNTALFTAQWVQLADVTNQSGTWKAYRLTVTRNGSGEVVYQSRDGVDFLYVAQQATAPGGGAWPFADGQWLSAERTGNGVETIYNRFTNGEGGDDLLQLDADMSLSDLTAAWQNANKDLLFSIAGGGTILLKDQNNAARAVERLMVGDGLTVELAQLRLPGASGTAGADVFLGGSSADSFSGGDGDDVISGGAGDDTLNGGAGDDILEGGAGADTLTGGADSVTADHAAIAGDLTRVYGDTIRYRRSSAAVTIDLQANTASGGHAQGDTISGIENIVGSDIYGDTLRGDGLANRIAGMGGADTIEGRGGDDVLLGGDGADIIYGGAGEDNIAGDAGDDVLHGGDDDDLIAGGEGADEIHGDAGADVLVGGAGNDTLHGGADADQLSGDEGADILYGDGGDDALVGGAGGDHLLGGDGADVLVGESGDDLLEGGAGDDVYVFDAASGEDVIVDAAGANKMIFAEVHSSRIWLTRLGDDLRVSVIGGQTAIVVSGYFAASNPTRMREIAAADASIFLAYAGPLIDAMTAASPGAQTVQTMLADYWHAGGKAAPQVTDQSHAINEDAPLTGTVGAIDHDENIEAYAIDVDASHGSVDLDVETGAWTYTPNANYYGGDTFSVRSTDADGHSVVQKITVAIASVNDAPHDIALGDALAAIEERDRPQQSVTLGAIVLGTLSASDVDAADAGDFDEFVFSVEDNRFEVFAGDTLRLKAGAALDFEAGESVNVEVTVRDRNGAGLFYTKIFTFAVLDRDDYLYGDASADVLTGQAGRNFIYGQGGADLITGANAEDVLEGGDGADEIHGLGGADTLRGGLGDDVLDGGEGGDILEGGEGDDTLQGAGGADQLVGGAGLDLLDGGAGADLLQGGDDPDHLVGGEGDDRLEGGAGDDVLVGGAGADAFLGGDGLDTVSYADAGAGVAVNLATGAGSAGDAAGDTFEDAVEKLVGSAHADTLTGSAGADIIEGGAGNDTILGGDGDDILNGGDGDDYIDAQGGGDLIIGGAGNDILIGGDDSDTYIIDINSGADEIRNFDPDGEDVDVIGYRDIDRTRLWFERSGDNLVISVIGSGVATTIKDWHLITDAGDRSNYKIDFILLGEHVSQTIDADGLVDFMALYTKPADMTAYNALHANSTFASEWTALWNPNRAPTVSDVVAQTINEDGTLTLTVRITDDITPVTGMTVNVSAVRMDDELVEDLSIVNAPTIGAPDANGDRILTVTVKPHKSGEVKIKIQAFDAGDLLAEEVFVLTIDPVVDAPSLDDPAAAAPPAPLSKRTLDSGELGPLSIPAALVDQDGSETLEVRIAGVPTGLSFKAGGVSAGTDLGDGLWSFTPAELSGLTIVGPTTWSADLTLTVTAISKESATGITATSAPKTLEIEINARPTDIAGTLEVDENSANGTSVGALSTTDADAGDTATYSFALVGGVAQNAGGRFAIDAETGAVTVANGALLDYEASPGGHTVRVKVTDSGGLTREEDFNVVLRDVNEAPTALTFANTTASLAENTSTASRIKVADLVLTDDALGAETFGLTGADAASFEILGSSLYVKAGVALNYEAKSSYAVTVTADDATVGANPDVSKSFSLSVTDVNEAPSLGAMTFSISENPSPGTFVGGAGGYYSDLDTAAVNRNPRYSIVGGATNFSIDAVSGNIHYQTGTINYEALPAPKQLSITVRVRDKGGTGLSFDRNVTISVLDVNEAPTGSGSNTAYTSRAAGASVGAISAVDPEGSSITYTIQSVYLEQYHAETDGTTGAYLANSTFGVSSTGGVTTTNALSQVANRDKTYSIVVKAADPSGAFGLFTAQVFMPRSQPVLPLVLDLDGDGVELISLASSAVHFDVDNDGVLDRTGWAAPDDGILALDRNSDGVISRGEEISFGSDLAGAASDLEGLAAFDSNLNGFFDIADAQFADFVVWRDANSDGVSQSGELMSLAQLDIVSINLTLTPTGAIFEGENIVYAHASFSRGDGSQGIVGDVFLAYEPGAEGGELPPVVLDLDGDGVSLVSRLASNVLFDADGDGQRQRTGWFGPGDGVLALDRNGDGMIGEGAEISFAADVFGAQTDLEGLAAYDSNKNGFLDSADIRFGEFLVWRDANQDGVSQAGELKSLADWSIRAINLTLKLTGQSANAAFDNRIYAKTEYVREDGSVGEAADVILSYDKPGGVSDMEMHRAPIDFLSVDGTASSRSRLARNQMRRSGEPLIHARAGRLNRRSNGAQPPVESEDRAPVAVGVDAGAKARPRPAPAAELTPADFGIDPYATTLAARYAADRSALHRGLGVSDKEILQMVAAIAAFEPSGGADFVGPDRRPKRSELLTSLPDVR